MLSVQVKSILIFLMLSGVAHADSKAEKKAEKKADSKYAVCSVPIVLKGTIVAEGKPEWSQAQIDDSETKDSRTFTLKRPWLRTGVKMIEIGKGFITVEVGKAKILERCFTEEHQFSAPDPVKAGPVPVKQVAAEASDGSPKSALKGAIDLLADFPGMAAKQKATKYGFWTPDYTTKAVKINGLRKKSPLYGLGMRSYDVLFSVNGVALDDPAKAREIYKNMESGTSKLIFEVKRRGKTIKLEYAP